MRPGMRIPDFGQCCSAGRVLYLNIGPVFQFYVAQSKQPSNIQFGDRTSQLHEISLMSILSTFFSRSAFMKYVCLIYHLCPMVTGPNAVHGRDPWKSAGRVN